jgi:hypothetical protein
MKITKFMTMFVLLTSLVGWAQTRTLSEGTEIKAASCKASFQSLSITSQAPWN